MPTDINETRNNTKVSREVGGVPKHKHVLLNPLTSCTDCIFKVITSCQYRCLQLAEPKTANILEF